MNPVTHSQNTTILPLRIPLALALVWLVLSPTAQAVVPPPDGGYPNFNTAEGQKALFSLTAGVGNTAVGALSLFFVTEGSFNTATGAGSLLFNTANQNTATGAGALLSNNSGDGNTAIGASALSQNTTGLVNTANGLNALFSNTTGSNNTANGEEALESSIDGNHNTAVGSSALRSLTAGNENIALGSFAGVNLTTGDRNIDVGNFGVAGEDHTMRIGSEGSQTRTFIAGIRGVLTTDSVPVVIDPNGQLGTIGGSARRFKNHIKPMDRASEVVLALKPVTFHYNNDVKSTAQFGLIAEEVAAVNSDLVVHDKEGKLYGVRYDQVNMMVLNEFLKEHRKNDEQGRDIQEQKATIALQQKQIEALTAGLQKVSAQLEASKSVPHVVQNNQ